MFAEKKVLKKNSPKKSSKNWKNNVLCNLYVYKFYKNHKQYEIDHIEYFSQNASFDDKRHIVKILIENYTCKILDFSSKFFSRNVLILYFHVVWQFWHYKSYSYIIKNTFENKNLFMYTRHMVGKISKFIRFFLIFFSKKMEFLYVVPYVCRYCKHFGSLTHTSKKIFCIWIIATHMAHCLK